MCRLEHMIVNNVVPTNLVGGYNVQLSPPQILSEIKQEKSNFLLPPALPSTVQSSPSARLFANQQNTRNALYSNMSVLRVTALTRLKVLNLTDANALSMWYFEEVVWYFEEGDVVL